MDLVDQAIDLLWRNALGVIPLAIAVAALARVVPMRPTTRHALWVAALIGFLAPPLLPGLARFGPPTAAELAERSNAALPVERESAPTIAKTPSVAATGPAPSTSGEPWRAPRVLTTPRFGAPAAIDLDATALHASPIATESPRRMAARTPATTALPPALRTASPTTDTAAPDAVSAASADRQSGAVSTPAAGARQGSLTSADAAREWGVTLLSLREALVAMPHIPAHVWLLGAMAALAIGCGRVWWFRRLLAKGRPATPEIERMVRLAGEGLNLRRTPTTVLVDERITPMVWCGRRARLVLPRPLWDDLDEIGRAAVVHHELAHLKRRDHWVCWAEAVVGLLYWWHPVAWWVRRRIREEADLCCDAWVIALLPHHRRAYAQALVSTRQYISEHGSAPPAVGLGVMSIRGKRFARRLLMIMTHSQKPRLSTAGRAMAFVVLAAGVIASPVLACPPDEKKQEHKARAHEKAPKAETPPAPDDRSTFERFMEQREAEETPAPPARIRGSIQAQGLQSELRSQLASLQSRLAETVEAAKADKEICASEQKKIDALSSEIERVATAVAHESEARAAAPAVTYVQDRGAGSSTYEQWAQGDEQIAKKYTLSDEKKLERLTALLVRDDVPLLVSPEEDGITVIGTRRQHERFGAFIALIDGESELQRVYALPEGRLDALSHLMVLNTVPVLVRPEDDGLRVWGSEAEQQIFAGFVDLLTSEADGGADVIIRSDRERARAIARERARERQRHDDHAEHEDDAHDDHEEEDDDDCTASRARALAGPQADARRQRELASRLQSLDRELAGVLNEAVKLDQKAMEVEAKAGMLDSQAEALDAQAEAISEQADELEDQADELEDQADEADERTAASLQRQAEHLRAKADELREKADGMHDKADEVRDKADELRDEADEMRDRAEEVRDHAEEIQEQREEAIAQADEEAHAAR